MAQIRINDIETVLFALLKAAFGLSQDNVVNGRNPSARPSGRFAMFQILGTRNHSFPNVSLFEDTEDVKSGVQDAVYVTSRITFFGQDDDTSGSLDALQQFAQDFRSGWRPSEIAKFTIGLGSISEPKAIPEFINARVIDRSYVDFEFYAVLATERPVDWFDRVDQTVSVPEIGMEETVTIQGETQT